MRYNFLQKLISVICLLTLLLSCVSSVYAADNKNEKELPVIMISGFGATTLTIDSEPVFPPAIKKILGLLLNNGSDIGKGIIDFIINKNFEVLGPPLLNIVAEILEPIKMNPDGTSSYDCEPILYGAKNTSLKAFKEKDMLDYVPYTGSEFLDMEMLAEKVGDDRVFNFLYDWRKSNYVLADELQDYIEEVLALTGEEKVRIYSISQGSLLLGEYFYKYADKGCVANAVFDTPLLGGSNFVGDIITTDDISLNYTEILALLGNILHIETDLAKLGPKLEGEKIHFAVDYAAKNVIVPLVLYTPAFWEMLPPRDFETFSNIYLDDNENAELIKTVKLVQNGFMSHISETLHKAEDYGAYVYIKDCYGFSLVSGTNVNSDGIVNTEYSCGAHCSEWGKTFDDNYVQCNTELPYSVSPDRTVDLSCGYYPEHTWAVSKLYHGQVEWDKNSLGLVMEMLFSDKELNAYESYEYPQFLTNYASTEDLAFVFDGTNSCLLSYDNGNFCKTATITNTSNKTTVVVSDISCENGSFVFNDKLPLLLKPGQSATLSFSGNFDSETAFDTLNIEYKNLSSLTKTLTKSFGVSCVDNYGGVVITNTEPITVKTDFISKLILRFVEIIDKLIKI